MTLNRSIHEDYHVCKQISKQSNASFPKTFFLLPYKKRRSLYAIYAYFRLLDDAVDDDGSVEEKRQRLESLTSEFFRSKRIQSSHSVIRALRHTIQAFSLSETPFEMMESGLRTDIQPVKFLSEIQLWHYCDCVAGSVGMVLTQLCGVPESIGQSYALSTGRALQLTNILRDVRNDANQNRFYLPKEWLERFQVLEHQLTEIPFTENVVRLLLFVGQINRALYDEARQVKPYAYPDELRFTETLRMMYYDLFQDLEAVQFDSSKVKKMNSLLILMQLLKHNSIV